MSLQHYLVFECHFLEQILYSSGEGRCPCMERGWRGSSCWDDVSGGLSWEPCPNILSSMETFFLLFIATPKVVGSSRVLLCLRIPQAQSWWMILCNFVSVGYGHLVGPGQKSFSVWSWVQNGVCYSWEHTNTETWCGRHRVNYIPLWMFKLEGCEDFKLRNPRGLIEWWTSPGEKIWLTR